MDPVSTRRDSSHSLMTEAQMQQAFHVGQLVRITNPSFGYGDRRIYCIVCQVPQTEGLEIYRIKNAVGVERLVRGEEIEAAALSALP
jgi:hypothetical protein